MSTPLRMTSILFRRCLMSIRCATGCQTGTYGIALIGLVLLALFVLLFCSLVSGRAVLRWPEVWSCMGYVHGQQWYWEGGSSSQCE